MFPRGVVYLHAAHLPVPKSLEAKSCISATSKLIQTKRLQLHYFGHLRKTGGRGSYRLVHTAYLRLLQQRLITVDCRLLAVCESWAISSISCISPAYKNSSRKFFLSPTYAKTGGGGTSSQISFLRSRLIRPLIQKCRRADIFDFSPDISHFLVPSGREAACPERGAKRLPSPLSLPTLGTGRLSLATGRWSLSCPLSLSSRQYCVPIALGLPETEPIRIPGISGSPPKWAGMSPRIHRCPDGHD